MLNKMENSFPGKVKKREEELDYAYQNLNVELKTDSVSATLVDLNQDNIWIGVWEK